jgi:hypothetical protein
MIEQGDDSMAINLSPDERASLKQLVRPHKPTKRQKAQALLGLAAGESAEAVAMRVGVPTEVVTELAVQFAERGLAGVGLAKRPEVVVTLIRAGVGAQKYRLPKGSTLDDLLDRSGASIEEQSVLIDEVVPERSLILKDGATVIIAPPPRNAASGEPLQTAVPSLQDDASFEEYRDILKGRRAQGAGVWPLNVADFKKVPGLVVVEADTGRVI